MSRVKTAARASVPAPERVERPSAPVIEAKPPRAPRAEKVASPAPAPRAFYQREPWLAALLFSFLTALAAVMTGPPVQMPLFYLTIALVVAGVLLLIFQKPDPEEERRMREREGTL
jgi:hypothetical protein